jgi:prepilin-type N-terminal cleavage/methylation domain-containing protein
VGDLEGTREAAARPGANCDAPHTECVSQFTTLVASVSLATGWRSIMTPYMQMHHGEVTMTIRLLTSRRSRSRRSAGFTLIELMITVAIVAILAAIAYPNYRNYVIRGQVVNATDGLSAVSANMERYFQDNRQYNSVTPGVPPASPCDTAVYPTITYGTFNLTCAVGAGATATFKITATGSGVTTNFTYTIDQAGNQGSIVAAPAPSAWIRTCGSTWETKEGTC